MSATALYLSACREALRGAPGLRPLVDILPALRAQLACERCGKLDFGRKPDDSSSEPPSENPCSMCAGPPEERRRLLCLGYARLCLYLLQTDAFKQLSDRNGQESDVVCELVREAAEAVDRQEAPSVALARNSYQDTGTQTQPQPQQGAVAVATPLKPLPNGSTYSVMYAGTGNKLTFKRKPPEEEEGFTPVDSALPKDATTNQNNFKKPTYRSRNSSNKRKGCRCGNATATPGKLTCCGQRCPCYVDSKPCTECKCKGCRNPHRADGLKVRPHIPQLDNIQLSMPIKRENSPSSSSAIDPLDTDAFEIAGIDQTITFNAGNIKPSDIKVYTSQLQEISADLPAAIMMDEDVSPESPTSGDSSSPHTQDGGNLTTPMTVNHSLLVPVHNLYIPYHRSSPSLSHQDNTSDIEVEV